MSTTVGSAREPPTPGADESPLTTNETATLWSKADGECRINETDDRTMEDLSQCTDVTFKEPPHTAATWTEADFGDLTPGNQSESVYPPSANLTDNRTIVDAHASIFAVHPSTRLQSEPGDETVYIAPDGSVRGFVDYRVRPPVDRTTPNRTVNWGVTGHYVTEVRLRTDDDVVATTDGTQTPIVEYSLSSARSTTLQLEADVEVRLQGRVSTGRGDSARSWTISRTDSVTVSDSMNVSVYDLQAFSYDATYPNGDTGLSIYQTVPWHGFSLGGEDDDRVRGVWRYYTARDTDWDVLNSSTEQGTTQRPSEALPVYVHAYPARIGPRAEPIRDGPTLVGEWGRGYSSPAPSLHENVSVGVVDEPYNRTDGIVVRHDDVDMDRIVVRGIVRNVTATPDTFAGQVTRTIRESNLTIERIDVAGDSATLRIELRDARTGDPIVLDNPALDNRSASPVGVEPRDGYITIDGQRVQTNASGVAIVTVDEPGVYTATYEPASWRANDPAYVGATARVKLHPLWTIAGWMQLLYHVFVAFAPFVVALYAGYRLNAFLTIEEYP